MSSSLFDLQDTILQWVEQQGFVTWKEVQRNCKSLVQFFTEEDKKPYGKFPEYRIFMPLVRNGCVEVCRTEKEKNGFRFVWNWRCDAIPSELASFDAMVALKVYPSIKKTIESFRDAKGEVSNDGLRVQCAIMKGYKYISCARPLKTGIYKVEDFPWYNEYLYDESDGAIRYIPNFESPQYDALNIARCYVRQQNGIDFFDYDDSKQELHIKNYTKEKEFPPRNLADDFPYLIMRALVCFDKEQLQDEEYYDRLTEDIVYKKVPKKAYKELKRIFGV